MSILDEHLATVFANPNDKTAINKLYAAFLGATFYLPTQADAQVSEEEPFRPLFAEEGGKVFMPIFDSQERLQTWAGEHLDAMNIISLRGHQVIYGIGNSVYLCLNLGEKHYKEFSPDEIKHLKNVVAKLMPAQDSEKPVSFDHE